MFAKHAYDRARAVARAVRLPVPMTRSRNRLAAVWRSDPVSGRLELTWQPAGRAREAADPAGREPAGRAPRPGHRRSPAAAFAA